MKTELDNLLTAYRQFCKAATAVADTWSNDEKIRNRAERQPLTSELIALLPKPLALGKVVDKISQACDL